VGSVRRAQPSDTAALTELVNRAYAIESSFVEGDRTTAGEIAALIRTGGFLVLEYAGGVGAAVLFQGPGQREGIRASHAYFGMLAVLPELQGRGLGRRLVHVVLQPPVGQAPLSLHRDGQTLGGGGSARRGW